MRETNMQGSKRTEEPVFHYFQMHKLVPDGHILKLVDKHVDFSFIRERVSHLYSEIGRPSVDPVLMVKMLIVGYLFGITSERRLCEEVGMHVGYRWFVGLNMEDKVPDHSTFSKNRHGRFRESLVWEEIFEELVRRCIAAGLVRGENLSADGTYVEANASMNSMEPIVVSLTPKKYLRQIERESAEPAPPTADVEGKDVGEKKAEKKEARKKPSNDTHRSRTDPDARLGKKSGSPFGLYHGVGYVMDNASGVILDAQVGHPGPNTEMGQALEGLDRAKWHFGRPVKTLGLDRGYRDADFLAETLERGVTPHVPILDMMRLNADLRGVCPRNQFTYDSANDCYICPQGKTMKYRGLSGRQKAYRASAKDCRICPMKTACTRDKSRTVSIHINNDALEATKKQMGTKAYRASQKCRKRIEALFGEAKEQMGFRRMKFRGRGTVAEQVWLTATAQNIKRLVKHLERLIPKPAAENRALGKQTGSADKTALGALLSAIMTICAPKIRGLRIFSLFSNTPCSILALFQQPPSRE